VTDPLGMELRGSEERGDAIVDDLVFHDPSGGAVEAYLVRPRAAPAGGSAGVIAWHWFDTEAPDGDRTQFLAEAAEVAPLDVVWLLPQGTFPWRRPPTGSAADAAEIEAEGARLRSGIDLLTRRADVDEARLGLIGHDFGGMIAALAAADEERLGAVVIVAATPRWADWFLPFWPIAEDRIDYLTAIRRLDPVERIGQAGPARLLFQFGRRDFYIAGVQGLDFQAAAPDGSELLAYDTEHPMNLPEIRADRRDFLGRTLGFETSGRGERP